MPKNRINFSNDFILKNEKIGINTDNPQALLDVNGDVKVSGIITSKNLNVTGNANFNSIGVGSDASSSGLNVIGNGNFTGILTASQFSTGNIGSSININNSTITGPGEILIDPAPIGTNTGVVRIKGDLFIDGNTTSLSSAEVRDFKISIASSIASDLVLDSAGIGIGSTSILKTFTWDYSSLSLKSSENINLAIGKTYKINGADVLNSATLGSGVVNSSLTSVGTLNQLRVTGISTFTNGPVLIGAATSTGTALQPLQVTGGAYVSGNLGIGTTNPTSKLHIIGDVLVSNVITATTFFGNLTGYASTAGIATYATNAGIATNVIGGIGSITRLQVTGISTFTNGPVLIGAATSTGTVSQTLQVTGGTYVSGNLGVGITNPVGQLQVNSGTSSVIVTGIGSVGIGTTLPQYKLHVVGDFGATTKSFSIPHPTKPGLTLRHGSLEGPENGVYVRGKTTESSIPLPDYWTGLVDEESISVNLTPKNGKLHSVVGISSNAVEIECIGGEIDCYFMILGERKDVAKLVAEY